MEYMKAGGNFNMKYEPEDPWPTQWTDWTKRYQPNQIPLKHIQIMDLENRVKDPVPLQPASTHQKTTCNMYFICNETFICHTVCQGRGYTFADRFEPQILYLITQTGTDLSNVETKIQTRGRFFVKKSLGFINHLIMFNAEKQMKAAAPLSFQGLAPKIRTSFE